MNIAQDGLGLQEGGSATPLFCVKWWNVGLPWVCEVAKYWQELEHTVIYADQEHLKHAPWEAVGITMSHSIHNVVVTKLLNYTTPHMLSAICPDQNKPGPIR